MKLPHECTDMQDIRAAIDALDHQIIALLGQWYGYVKAAAQFKTSEEGVRAPERFRAMLEQRRAWAAEQGLSADVIEKLYAELVQYFIDEEMQTWKARASSVPTHER